MSASVYDFKNRFSKEDHAILREGFHLLTLKEREALTMRFWENHSIYEIAFWLDLTWDEADQLLKQAFLKLKDFCLDRSDFSLSKPYQQTMRLPMAA